MEKEKPEVIFLPAAMTAIEEVGVYIADKGYPESAKKYTDKLTDFGYSLTVFPNKYPVCRYAAFAQYNYHCATFDKAYVFVHKAVKNQLIIYNVIHGKRLG